MSYDPIRLEIFKHLFASIAEEMGVSLRKASFSANIKERRDFSCAIFDPLGNMVAQAAHIPVHLGSMPLSVISAIDRFCEDTSENLAPGDVVILNDPFLGGTHLPDITLVTPVFMQTHQAAPESSPEPGFQRQELLGFAASRAHHADVGGISPGSMPVAREIYQEGLILPPIKLFAEGVLNQGVMDLILANVRTPEERSGDLWAQIAANQRGADRLREMAGRYGMDEVVYYMRELLAYTERMTRQLLANLPDGVYHFEDYLDGDGILDENGEDEPVRIRVSLQIKGDQATVDFSGSAVQQKGSINAVFAITLSAVYYVFRSLLELDVPNNSGCLKPIQVVAPPGSVVNARHPAAVAGGNVETSQRIVDVLLGALATACPERIPAASQGTMNNLSIGGWDAFRDKPFAYYETIGGGTGAWSGGEGVSAIHSHMTNTLNTPVEALEYTYPFTVLRYEIRRGSGGEGYHRGGDGIRRDLLLGVDSQVTILSERRLFAPYGLAGGQPGSPGQNLLIRNGVESRLPGKGYFELKPGDVLSIRTPGGGGYGASGD